MSDKLSWDGASGESYIFKKFSLSVNFKPDQNGVYIFAKETSTGYDAVYIGQGDLKDALPATCLTGV